MGIVERVLQLLGRRSNGDDRNLDALGGGSAESVLVEARALAPVMSDILEKVAASIRAGTTTLTIDQGIERALAHSGLEPIMKGHRGYPAARRNGVCVAQGWTFPVGSVSADDGRMLSTASRALRAAESVVRAGARVGDIGAAIQGAVEAEGLVVIRTFVGAAIGRQLHEPPAVPCYGVSGRGQRLTTGLPR